MLCVGIYKEIEVREDYKYEYFVVSMYKILKNKEKLKLILPLVLYNSRRPAYAHKISKS